MARRWGLGTHLANFVEEGLGHFGGDEHAILDPLLHDEVFVCGIHQPSIIGDVGQAEVSVGQGRDVFDPARDPIQASRSEFGLPALGGSKAAEGVDALCGVGEHALGQLGGFPHQAVVADQPAVFTDKLARSLEEG